MPRTLVAITGASSGIGEAFARKLAPEHDLLLIARRTERLEKLAAEFAAQYPGRFDVLTADLTVPDHTQMVADRLAGEESLALLINNAGFGTPGFFWQAPLAPQEQMHQLHVMATVRLTHATLRNLVAKDYGAVINVASVAAFIHGPGTTSYSATKTWMAAFTEGLHAELRKVKSRVRVQALCPGYTYSEFHDLLGEDRQKLGPRGWWHSADSIVDASLAGLQQNQVFVVPGWRYRLLTAFFAKAPTRLRLFVESHLPDRRQNASLPPAQKIELPGGNE